MDCVAEGDPQPEISWEGPTYYDLDDIKLANNSLKFVNIEAVDSGTYFCYADSRLGTIVAQFSINVRGKYVENSFFISLLIIFLDIIVGSSFLMSEVILSENC